MSERTVRESTQARMAERHMSVAWRNPDDPHRFDPTPQPPAEQLEREHLANLRAQFPEANIEVLDLNQVLAELEETVTCE